MCWCGALSDCLVCLLQRDCVCLWANVTHRSCSEAVQPLTECLTRGNWTVAMEIEPNGLVELLAQLVAKGDHDGVCAVLADESKVKELKDLTWDLVPAICVVLSEPVAEDHPGVLPACERILQKIAGVASPKELLVVLLEQANHFNTDSKFKGLLAVLQKVLLKLPGKRAHSLGLCFSTLYAHIQTIPTPPDYGLEGEEIKLLDCDDDVRRCNDVVAAMVHFLDPFVKEVSLDDYDATAKQQKRSQDKFQRKEILQLIIKMFDHPLAYLDLTQPTQEGDGSQPVGGQSGQADKQNTERPVAGRSETQVLSEVLMGKLEQLSRDFLHDTEVMLLENQRNEHKRKVTEKRKRDPDIPVEELADMDWCVEEDIPLRGMAVWGYLVFGEALGLTSLPCVYTPTFCLEHCMPFIIYFLKENKPAFLDKGLSLFASLLQRIPEQGLAVDMLDKPEMVDMVTNLVYVMIGTQSKELRTRAVKILPLLLSRLSLQGRHQIFLHMFKKVNHSGVAGYVTQLLKQEIDATLKQDAPSVFFTGPPLEKLLRVIFLLPDGATTDLLEQSERVMGALNLLRYLILRDPKAANQTNIWSFLPVIEKEYLDALRTGINMSRAHYQAELEKVNKGLPLLDAAAPDMSVTVAGQPLPTLTKDQQKDVMHTAIHTFDMMESIVGRISELVHQKERENIGS